MRRRMMMGKRLPYDAEVEYLMSDGNAYIDTDIVLTSEHIADVDFTFISLQRILGCRFTNYASYGIYSQQIDINSNINNISNGRLSYNFIDGVRYIAHSENKNRYIKDVGGEVLAMNNWDSPSFTTIYKTPIFGLRWGADNVTAAQGCIHSLVITLYNDVLLDLIPVRKGNVGYMYDKVSGKLFGNAGTGQFILGPDK